MGIIFKFDDDDERDEDWTCSDFNKENLKPLIKQTAEEKELKRKAILKAVEEIKPTVDPYLSQS